MFRAARIKPKPFTPFAERPPLRQRHAVLECGGHGHGTELPHHGAILTSDNRDLIEQRFPVSWEAQFSTGDAARIAVDLAPLNQVVMGLKVAVPRDARPGQLIELHFMQRSLALKKVVGGITVRINVAGAAQA
jgi:hypothetical protein